MLPPGSSGPRRVAVPPASAIPFPAPPNAPIAEIADGRSGTEDTCSATPATAHPVPKIHNTPLSTARVSAGGLPFPSGRCCGRRIGSKRLHCRSLTSQRPRIALVLHQIARTPSVSPACPSPASLFFALEPFLRQGSSPLASSNVLCDQFIPATGVPKSDQIISEAFSKASKELRKPVGL